MIPPIIALAIICSLSTLAIRVIISRHPFRIKNVWRQIFGSLLLSAIAWVALIYITRAASPTSNEWGDIICGVLIFLCAFWCHYWIGNFAGGFRVQMQVNLANQKVPIALEEWMKTFSGLGMETFLQDRIQAILIPWNTVEYKNGQLHLLNGWGTFFASLMNILKYIFPKVRGE
ncbi:MAG: hypothetical protein IPP66_16550 [Anaerolineales bacterium]|nr:hypothetical protein [Anaerolineales bacterium]